MGQSYMFSVGLTRSSGKYSTKKFLEKTHPKGLPLQVSLTPIQQSAKEPTKVPRKRKKVFEHL